MVKTHHVSSHWDLITSLHVSHNLSSSFVSVGASISAIFCFHLFGFVFALLYGSFYNEVVLCDDLKLWCSSIVFQYLMSGKYGLKICSNRHLHDWIYFQWALSGGLELCLRLIYDKTICWAVKWPSKSTKSSLVNILSWRSCLCYNPTFSLFIYRYIYICI